MPRGGPRGNKRTHKGQRRHFTDESEIRNAAEKEERQKEWRRRQGIESDEEEEEEGASKGASVAPGDLPPSGSSSEEDSEEESDRHKGVEHLIEIENPNRMKGKTSKKVTEMEGKAELTRREREEIEKQQAKANYQKMHMAGKTEEARADLARLALIKKQREEAAKKRELEKAQQDAAKKKS